jgi:hypothetical protein
LGNFVGTNVPIDAETLSAIPSADIIERQYTAPSGTSIGVTVIGGTGRNQLHDPRSCLAGAGWQILNDHVETLPGTNISVRCCQVTNPTPEQRESDDIIYLYVVNCKPISSASTIRWTLLKSDLLGQSNEPVYFIRTVIPLSASTDGSSAATDQHRELLSFTSSLWHVLSPVIYRGEAA